MLDAPPARSGLTTAAIGLTKIVAAIFVVALLWQGAIAWFGIPRYIVPPPMEVAAGFYQHAQTLSRQTLVTLTSSAIGLVISTLLATLIGVAFTLSKRAAQASLPLVIMFRSAPIAAVAPIIMLFLGRGIATSVAVVIIVSFFPLLVNLMRAVCISYH